MGMEINARLRALADQLDGTDPTPLTVARALRGLADRTLVELPTIDPTRDDLGHWYALPLARLHSENAADAWNLAAGLREERTRANRRAALAEDLVPDIGDAS